MMKNWMIFILVVLVILSNIWREHQVEAMMERGEHRYEQAVLQDEQKIATLQAQIDHREANYCYLTTHKRGLSTWECTRW